MCWTKRTYPVQLAGLRWITMNVSMLLNQMQTLKASMIWLQPASEGWYEAKHRPKVICSPARPSCQVSAFSIDWGLSCYISQCQVQHHQPLDFEHGCSVTGQDIDQPKKDGSVTMKPQPSCLMTRVKPGHFIPSSPAICFEHPAKAGTSSACIGMAFATLQRWPAGLHSF